MYTIQNVFYLELDPADSLKKNEQFHIQVDSHSTFEDLKIKIQEKEDYEPSQVDLFYEFYPLANSDVVLDILEEGAKVTALVKDAGCGENLITSTSCEVVFLMIVDKSNIHTIPLKTGHERRIPNKFGVSKFGLLEETKGADGTREFICSAYEIEDGAGVVIHPNKVYQHFSDQRIEVEVDKEKVLSESELLGQGSLIQNVKNVLHLLVEELLRPDSNFEKVSYSGSGKGSNCSSFYVV